MARYIAKNMVAAGIAPQIEVQLSYAIGQADPVSIAINTFGTVSIATNILESLVRELFDCRPAAIIQHLGLNRPIYRQTAAFGHFGRTDIDLPWEKTDKVDEIIQLCAKHQVKLMTAHA